MHFEGGKLCMSHAALPELLTISGVTLLEVTIGRVVLLEIIIMTSELCSPTTFVESQITMTLTNTNLNGNIIKTQSLKKFLYRYY